MTTHKTFRTYGLTVISLLAMGSVVLPQLTPASAQPSPAPFAPHKDAEKHPEIRKALANLQRARIALQSAAHDFAGHREKALDLTDKAIEEAKLALASDK